MGAVTFSLDHKLLKMLSNHLKLDVFVETGSFKGDTIELAKSYFKEIHSVELSKEYFESVCARFKNHDAIHLIHDTSPAAIAALQPKLNNRSTLYWLDAHWCVATDTAGEQSQCPLLLEIQAIKNLNSDSIIIIDDARLFLTAPPAPHEISDWPSFNEIISHLSQLSSSHALMVLNDCIIFYPERLEKSMQLFAHEQGIDWLKVIDKSRQYDKLLQQLKEKDQEIFMLTQACEERAATIHDLTKGLWGILNRIILRAKLFFKPKLGLLHHYQPKALQLSEYYTFVPTLQNIPTISIVTPSYNQGPFLEKTLTSVLNQNYPSLEFIIQDGGSTDNSVALFKKYNDQLKHWESSKDKGQSNAINLGFNHATGDIMAYLNSDDILLPGALNYVAKYFEEHPDVDVIYSHRILINHHDEEVGRWILPKHDNKILSTADFIPQETLFWRRRIWEKAGGKIDESFNFAMDWDLILRFRDCGAKFVRVPRFLAAFRVHPQQKTYANMAEQGVQEMDRLRKRYFSRELSAKEVHRRSKLYLLKHLVYHKLFKAGILKY